MTRLGGNVSEGDRPGARLGFYLHLVGYVLINGILIALNRRWTPGAHWFYWPLIAWGLGVALHGASVTLHWRFWPRAWEGPRTDR